MTPASEDNGFSESFPPDMSDSAKLEYLMVARESDHQDINELHKRLTVLGEGQDLLHQKLDWIVNQVMSIGKMFQGGNPLMSLLKGGKS